jgi:TPR repeat protein
MPVEPVLVSQKRVKDFPLLSGERKSPIDVWGVCVSRDIFGIVSDYFFGMMYDGDVDINYFRATSFITQTTGHAGPDLVEEDFYGIKTAADRFSHKSSITGAVRDYNKTLLKEMSESGSEWLIVDGRVEIYGLYKIQYADGSFEYMSGKIPDWVGAVDEILTKKGVDHTIEEIGKGYPGALYRKSLSVMADFLKSRYGDRIILVEASGSEVYLDDQCRIQQFKREESQCRNDFLRSFEEDFVRATGCRRIRQPRFIVSDFFHKWGGSSPLRCLEEYSPAQAVLPSASGGSSPVHYVEEYYWYAFRAVSLYIDGDEDAEEKADLMYEECSDFMLALREGSVSSLSNVLGWCRRMIFFRRYKEAYAKLRALSDAGEPRAMVMRGEMKIRGIGTMYDMKGALHLYATAFRAGFLPASSLLFDQVAENGPYNTAFGLLRRASLEGCRSSMSRLAIAFLEGKGTKKSVSKAAFWFDKAVEGGKDSDRYRLFDVIWRLGGKASERRMVSVISPLAKEDREAKMRMGLAYQEGRGVLKDLSDASVFYQESALLGSSTGAARLFDIVWDTRSADQYAYVAEMVRKFADSGDPKSMWRLGKAYRFGKGVERDLDLAKELCYNAFLRAFLKAGNELSTMLWDEGTVESTETMKALVNRHIARGSGWAYGRLALMYLRGRGVERNVPKAVKYARIAAEDESTEAYEILMDVLWETNTERSAKEMMSVIAPHVGMGEGWAVRRLALMYLHGRGVERDAGKALELLRLAVEKDSILAYRDLFDILWESDDEKAEEEMSRIVDYFVGRGEGEAYRLRGRMFRYGVGAEKDLEKATECIRAAVDAKVAEALPDLCDVLLETGSDEAVEEAESLAARYAELNEPWALNRLANMRIAGIGSKKDTEEGVRLHIKAIGHGSSESARDFYDYARSTRNVETIEKAIGILRRHAEGGDPDCMIRLGKMHWEGDGAPYDRSAALEWMQAASVLRREYRQECRDLARKDMDAGVEDEER